MIDYGVKINVGGNADRVLQRLVALSEKMTQTMRRAETSISRSGTHISESMQKAGSAIRRTGEQTRKVFEDASRAARRAKQEFQGIGPIFSGINSKLAALGLSVGAVDIGRRIINAGASEEDALARLRFALKDEGKARAMLGDLKQMGRTMPIAISDIYKQAGFLAPVFKENTQKYLKMFADVVAGSGGDFGNIAFNFAQIKQLGRSQGIDLKQFAYQNIPIFEELSKLIGKSTEEILKMSTEGKISFNIVAKAFENMTKEGGIYFGAVEARAKTFRGQWQIIANKLEEIWVKFFEKARPYLQQFSDWVEKQIENFDELWPKIKLAGELIATYFSVKVLANFISSLNTIRKTLVAISSIKLTGVLTQFGTIGGILKGIGGPLAAILAFFGLINYGHGNASGQGYQAMSLEELKAERERLIALRDKPVAKDLQNVTDEEFANIHRNATNKTSSDTSSKIDEIERVIKQKEAFSAFRDSTSGVNSAMGGISDINTDLSPRGVSGNGGIKNFQITFNSPVVQIDDKHVEGEKYTPEQLGQIAAKEFVNIATQIALR